MRASTERAVASARAMLDRIRHEEMTTMGPYDNERQTWAEPMPQAVRALHDADRVRSGDPDRLVRDTMLHAVFRALAEAGVDTTIYEGRILDWLCGWEPSTVQVVIGLVSRAYEAGRRSALDAAVE